MDQSGLESVRELYPEMVSWRRKLHMHPELSFQEAKTAKFVAHLLREWQVDYVAEVGGHGIVATIEGELPGPTIAFRADMDALPIQDCKQVSYASRVKGVMHACGHDGHTSVLLGVAKLLSSRRATLAGTIKLVFQHAEEMTPGGAQSILASGLLRDVSSIYGMHLWTPLPSGKVATCIGPFMAAADEFSIEITGKGGHAGLPHEAIDSVLIGSQLVVQLQSIVSRHVNPIEPVVLTVASFHAGSAFNVIAEKAVLHGTVRTFREAVREDVVRRMTALVEHTSAIHDCPVQLRYTRGFPALVNHARETGHVEQTAVALFGRSAVLHSPPVMAGEDFAYYTREIPGCFAFIGAGNPDHAANYPHHHPLFDFDESSMMQAALLFLKLAISNGRSTD